MVHYTKFWEELTNPDPIAVCWEDYIDQEELANYEYNHGYEYDIPAAIFRSRPIKVKSLTGTKVGEVRLYNLKQDLLQIHFSAKQIDTSKADVFIVGKHILLVSSYLVLSELVKKPSTEIVLSALSTGLDTTNKQWLRALTKLNETPRTS